MILAIWRHGFRRQPLEYDPQWWGAVFPLGMYAVATFRMADALDLDFLDGIPRVFLGLALVAWLAVFIGMIRSLGRLIADRNQNEIRIDDEPGVGGRHEIP